MRKSKEGHQAPGDPARGCETIEHATRATSRVPEFSDGETRNGRAYSRPTLAAAERGHSPGNTRSAGVAAEKATISKELKLNSTASRRHRIGVTIVTGATLA